MTRKLRDLEIEEISLVNKAATRKKFMIIKNQGGVNTMEDVLKDFIVDFSEDEDVEDFQKAENKDKLREKLQESLKEIEKFADDLPDSLRKAISVLAQWAYKGYGYPGAGKKPIKKKEDKFPSITAQLFGDD